MAIFGAGSNWDGAELKDSFFQNDNYLIGWNRKDAQDLYSQISTIKVGDFIYLKANRPGSLDIRVKGIGIVKHTFLDSLFEDEHTLSSTAGQFYLPVHWIIKDEFYISIPPDTGKLTNVRAATLYEEFLPFVQTEILNKIFSKL